MKKTLDVSRQKTTGGAIKDTFPGNNSKKKRNAISPVLLNKEFLRTVLNLVDALILVFDAQGKIVMINEAGEEETGYTLDELSTKGAWEIFGGTDETYKARQAYEKHFSRQSLKNFKRVFMAKDGTKKLISWSTKRLKDKNGAINYIIATGINVTEREQAAQRIRALSQFQESVIDNANVWINVLDEHANVVIWNKAAEGISGYSRDEIMGNGMIWGLLYPEPEYREEITRKAAAIIEQGEVVENFETTIQRKDGQKRTISWHSQNLTDERGKPIGSIAIGRDITERKEAIEAMRRAREELENRVQERTAELLISNERLRQEIAERLRTEEALRKTEIEKITILESISEHVVYHNPDLKILWCNMAAAESVGKTPEELVGRHCYEIWHERTSPCPGCPVIEAFKTGHPEQNEIHTPEGRVWLTRGYPVHGADGNVSNAVEVALDITLLKRTEDKLRKSLESLETAMESTIKTITRIVEAKDPYTAGHQQRVAQLACAIAIEMGLGEDIIKCIHTAALIHDIGKIYVPSEILSKPGPLTEPEINIVRTHPKGSYDILKDIEFPWPIAEIAYQHHERLDGSGYPRGLKGEEIRLEARILGVADVVETISSHRPYRPAIGVDDALDEIETKKNLLYDAHVVECCLRLFREKGFEFEKTGNSLI